MMMMMMIAPLKINWSVPTGFPLICYHKIPQLYRPIFIKFQVHYDHYYRKKNYGKQYTFFCTFLAPRSLFLHHFFHSENYAYTRPEVLTRDSTRVVTQVAFFWLVTWLESQTSKTRDSTRTRPLDSDESRRVTLESLSYR